MKINGLGGFSPTGVASGPAGGNPMVDALVEAERAPVKSATQRKDNTVSGRDQLRSFDGLLDSFGAVAEKLKRPTDFGKLKLDSSHPELLDGVLSPSAKIGSFELELESLARNDRQLAFGFQDADKTPVGFGYMQVGVGDKLKDLTIDPGATLNDVASKINDLDAGVRAMIVNTGHKEDPFRLLVSSIETGEEARISIDEDTTFTEFKNIVQGKNLSAKFEGVDIVRNNNKIEDLIDGVTLNPKNAAPGTKIKIDIRPDVDNTAQGIDEFVRKYNEVIQFARKEVQIDPNTGKAGVLAGESSLRSAVRKLQNAGYSDASTGGLNLSDIGITTDPFSGELKIDQNKVKDALTKDFDKVTQLFASTESGPGLAQKLSDAVKTLRDRQHGVISTRLRGLDQKIKSQDMEITRHEERAAAKKARIEKTFASLQGKISSMEGTSQFLAQRFSPGKTGTE